MTYVIICNDNLVQSFKLLKNHSTDSAGNGVPISNGKEEDYAWLAEIETPDDLYMRPGVYVGPAIKV